MTDALYVETMEGVRLYLTVMACWFIIVWCWDEFMDHAHPPSTTVFAEVGIAWLVVHWGISIVSYTWDAFVSLWNFVR